MENNNLNQDILDKITKTCRCKVISKATIKNAIKNGASTLEEVQKATGAGSGCCKGKNCSYIINKLIDEFHN